MKNLVLLSLVLGFASFAQATPVRDCKKVYNKAMNTYNVATAQADADIRVAYEVALTVHNEAIELAVEDQKYCAVVVNEIYVDELKNTTNNKSVNEAIARRDESLKACNDDYTSKVELTQAGYKDDVAAAEAKFNASIAEALAQYNVTVNSCK